MVGRDARQVEQLVWSTEVEEKRSREAGVMGEEKRSMLKSVVCVLMDSKLKAIEGTFSSAGDCGPCMLCRWGQQVWPSPSAEKTEKIINLV